jgi:hypothetical protein
MACKTSSTVCICELSLALVVLQHAELSLTEHTEISRRLICNIDLVLNVNRL